MFRTIALRSDLARNIIRKSVRTRNTTKFTVECTKRRNFHRLCTFDGRNHVVATWKTINVSLIRNYSSDLPSHTRVALPALSPTMESGSIISWEKKEGDKLNEGDLLAEIETDKATMGFETPEEGYLAKIIIPAGTKDVPIGKLVCIIVESEDDVAAFKDFKDDSGAAAAKKPSTPPPAAAAPSEPPSVAASEVVPPPAADTGRVYASPMAKKLAEQRNIRLQGKGSGIYGSLTAADVASGTAATSPGVSTPPPPSAGPYTDIPITGIRSTIAKRLLQSKQQVPHYYLSIDINIDNIMKIRTKYNKKLEKNGIKLSLNDFIIKATAQASLKVPEANSAWLDNVIRQYKNVDVSVAVSTERGLITPIIFEANNKGVIEISKLIKELAGKARDGKLQPNEFQGGTISVSNLGMFGINQFCAIINPPQSCILAVGTVVKRLTAADNDKGFEESQFLTVTLSSDHRVVDGAVGAKWLQAFKEHLEDPVSMII